ncbi:hypothetical protein DFQ05_1124 [Winogradskyella wandonensis]|uniref:Cupin domain-containing protein n=1 Tax=Winogradskyella wandonensis TaxID=1442586 RepID=A0A4R1KRY7_9FLAO|nr:cupin domain-containing protein [Winogradskyella wandonensis]TCK67350.1 hypothetical protein DFQ05_1124 [Winogradskyella wandonensis]
MRLSRYIVPILLIILFNCNDKPQLPDPLEAGWKNKNVCEVLEENKALRVLKCTFPPNIGHELHYHNPHVGYTISGSKFRIKDATGVREVNVPTGYSFSNDKKTSHEVLNVGDSTAVFLIMEYR